MYKLCKTEQSAIRQRQLELGLMEAMANHHFDEISVSDLCDRMQIPRKSFYRYFSGKDGALHALIDHTLLEMEWIPEPPEGTAKRRWNHLEGFFLFWKKHKILLDALERSGMSGVLIERAIHQAVTDSNVRSRFMNRQEVVEREHATMFAVCGLMSMVLQWHHDGYNTSAERMAFIAMQVLTKPLYQEK